MINAIAMMMLIAVIFWSISDMGYRFKRETVSAVTIEVMAIHLLSALGRHSDRDQFVSSPNWHAIATRIYAIAGLVANPCDRSLKTAIAHVLTFRGLLLKFEDDLLAVLPDLQELAKQPAQKSRWQRLCEFGRQSLDKLRQRWAVSTST